MFGIVFLITNLRMFHFVMRAKINPGLFYNTKINTLLRYHCRPKRTDFNLDSMLCCRNKLSLKTFLNLTSTDFLMGGTWRLVFEVDTLKPLIIVSPFLKATHVFAYIIVLKLVLFTYRFLTKNLALTYVLIRTVQIWFSWVVEMKLRV